MSCGNNFGLAIVTTEQLLPFGAVTAMPGAPVTSISVDKDCTPVTPPTPVPTLSIVSPQNGTTLTLGVPFNVDFDVTGNLPAGATPVLVVQTGSNLFGYPFANNIVRGNPGLWRVHNIFLQHTGTGCFPFTIHVVSTSQNVPAAQITATPVASGPPSLYHSASMFTVMNKIFYPDKTKKYVPVFERHA